MADFSIGEMQEMQRRLKASCTAKFERNLTRW